MGLARVQGFLTSDGKFFFGNDKDKAEAHQTQLDFLTWCDDNICTGGEWTSRMVANHILSHFDVHPKKS